MTIQSPDTIEYNGKTYCFYSSVFASYLELKGKEIEFEMISSANYRGTFESYIIIDGRLFLKEFFGYLKGDLPRKKFTNSDSDEDDYNIDKSFFFSKSDEKIIHGLVLADWYCGVIETDKSDLFMDEWYHMIVDYGEVIQTKKFIGEITEGLNLKPCIYDYHRYCEPSENDDGLYKYEYSLIVRLSKYDYILEDKSKEDLLLLARDFNSYKDSLEGKSYYEKKNIFNSELNRLKGEAEEGKLESKN